MSGLPEINIRELSVADLQAIISVHICSFPKSATTRLGAETVRRFYEWLLLGPHHARYFGAWVGDQLGAFCIGGQFEGALIGFLRRNRAYLCFRLLTRPWLLASREVREAASTAISRLRSPTTVGSARSSRGQEKKFFGILVIATKPSYRRLGLGATLMAEAESAARSLQCGTMGLTVSPANESAVRFYRRLGWVAVTERGEWTGRMEKRLTHD